MHSGRLVAVLVDLILASVGGTSVDINQDYSTQWETPPHVTPCPLHKQFRFTNHHDGSVDMLPAGGGMFSVAQKLIPVSARPVLNRSTGLIIRYSSPPGAAGVSLWRIRVSSAMDTTYRFVHLFSIPANGVVNETRYMPWRDFFGQIIERKSTKIQKCGKDIIGDPRCTIKPEMLTHVSFLESEDTIAHAIELHQVILTTDPIAEQNQLQHPQKKLRPYCGRESITR